MRVHEDDQLLSELRRILTAVDPVPLPVKLAARNALRWHSAELGQSRDDPS